MGSAYSGPIPDPDSEYFDNKRIFILSGHGGNNPEDTSYTLARNEFYAAPTRCGLTTFGAESQWFSFIRSNPRIEIPTSESKSFYTLNYENFPFKTTKSIIPNNLDPITKQILPGREANIETNSFKMYVPFSSKEKTHSIPNNLYSFFPFLRKQNLPITKPTFNFNGKVYDKSNFGKCMIGTLMISGILSPNTDTEIFEEEFERIQIESNALLNAIGNYPSSRIIVRPQEETIIINKFGKSKNIPYPMVNILFIVLPEYAFNKNILDDYSRSDPLLDYCKRAMNLMSSLSVIPIEEFAPDKDTFGGRLFAFQPISNVFKLIRKNLSTHFPTNINEPILLLNPLCRNTLNNASLNRILIENATNIRSLSKSRNTKRYKNFRNKTRKFAAKNRNLRKIIPKLYGPVSKKVVNIPTVANLTNIPETNIQQFLDSYGNDNIIRASRIESFFNTLFKYVPVAY